MDRHHKFCVRIVFGATIGRRCWQSETVSTTTFTKFADEIVAGTYEQTLIRIAITMNPFRLLFFFCSACSANSWHLTKQKLHNWRNLCASMLTSRHQPKDFRCKTTWRKIITFNLRLVEILVVYGHYIFAK